MFSTREKNNLRFIFTEITIRDADRIAVIADGHCTEYGTYDELMALKGEFYQLKQIQS